MEVGNDFKNYLELEGRKSGFVMRNNSGLYLFGNRKCEAICELLTINSERLEVNSDFCDNLLLYLSEEQNKITVYKSGKLVLNIKELLLLYTVPLGERKICGIISGGASLPCQDVHYSDERISRLIRTILRQKSRPQNISDNYFIELANELEKAEIKSLSELNLRGEGITANN
ncbi:MAG: hypothetical protein J1F28_08695 [Oscillospiraceae bacterium]|nr:hypothetical protein [Oscillospiraceae bacterium]